MHYYLYRRRRTGFAACPGPGRHIPEKSGKVRAEGITGGSELTPIVVNGMMYIATNTRVVALEPESGKEIWTYEMKNGEPTRRGIAFWPGDGNIPPRVFFTSGPRLIGLS